MKPRRFNNESLRPKEIARSFAIGTREVTGAQFGKFLKATLTKFRSRSKPECTARRRRAHLGVTWYEAAA